MNLLRRRLQGKIHDWNLGHDETSPTDMRSAIAPTRQRLHQAEPTMILQSYGLDVAQKQRPLSSTCSRFDRGQHPTKVCPARHKPRLSNCSRALQVRLTREVPTSLPKLLIASFHHSLRGPSKHSLHGPNKRTLHLLSIAIAGPEWTAAMWSEFQPAEYFSRCTNSLWCFSRHLFPLSSSHSAMSVSLPAEVCKSPPVASSKPYFVSTLNCIISTRCSLIILQSLRALASLMVLQY